jgi:transcriptional regulator of acetoin/glycerol metabolism
MDTTSKRLELIHLCGNAEIALKEITESLTEEQFNKIFEDLVKKISIKEMEERIRSELLKTMRDDYIVLPKNITMVEAEKEIIKYNLNKCSWNISKAAEELGIGRKTLHRKISEYNLDKSKD